MIPWVAGNTLNLAVPLQTKTIVSGQEVTAPYTPPAGSTLNVWLVNGRQRRKYDYTLTDNVVHFTDNGTLSPATYAVEIQVIEPSTRHLRTFKLQLCVTAALPVAATTPAGSATTPAGSPAGSPILSVATLSQQYDAVVISTGTPTARDLKAPGRELKGVHFALEMLSQQNRVLAGMEFSKDERVTAKGKDVLVIGGGDTGSDCIGTAHRQGCKSVTQIEIMPKPVEGPEDPQNPWPEWPRTLKTTSSHEEGCTRRWNINTLEFLGKDGKLTGVKVQEIDWKPNPEGGRPIMVEKGKPEIIKAELVLLAMGFLKPEHPEYPKNVFVCGDAANGASLVVRAMASGRQIAQKVNGFLQK